MLSAGRLSQRLRSALASLDHVTHAEAGAVGCSRDSSIWAQSPQHLGWTTEVQTCDKALLSSQSEAEADLPRSSACIHTDACAAAAGPSSSAGSCSLSSSSGARHIAFTSSLRWDAPTGPHSTLPCATPSWSFWPMRHMAPSAAAAPPTFLSVRSYHTWYYASKLRNRIINSARSLDELARMLRHDGDRLDHINLAVFLKRLQLAATAEAAKASSFSAGAPSVTRPGAGAGSASSVAAASAAAAGRAVQAQMSHLATEVSYIIRRRAKWYDPRHAALVVSRTALLGHTDPRMLHLMTARMLGRLNEAYSKDLLLLLRGLHAHARLAAATAAAELPQASIRDRTPSTSSSAAEATALAVTATPVVPSRRAAHPPLATRSPLAGRPSPVSRRTPSGRPLSRTQRRIQEGLERIRLAVATHGSAASPERLAARQRALRGFVAAPEALMGGVRTFLAAKVPTGRMPPDNLDGLLRYSRALSGQPVGADLCALVEEDLRRRMPIYGPAPLAGLLSTLAAERHYVPVDLLDAAAVQFTTHCTTYGTGAIAARFLAAATALLRAHHRTGQASTSAAASASAQEAPVAPVEGPGEPVGAFPGLRAAPSPAEWLGARPELLMECLELMARDIEGANPTQTLLWAQILVRAEVPLAKLAASAASSASSSTTSRSTAAGGGGDAAASAATTVKATSPSSSSVTKAAPPAAAAAAAAQAFVRAHARTTEQLLMDGGPMTPEQAARLRTAYDTLGLPYPRGL